MTSLTKIHFQKIALFAFSVSFLFFLLITPVLAEQEKFTPLVGIPGITSLSESTSLTDYINALYKFTIALGALLGVLRIAMAGVKYSMTEIVTHKGEAISDIQGVLLGMGILLIPFIVLNTIYPNLTNLEVLKSAPDVKLDSAPSGNGGSGNSGPPAGTVVCSTGYQVINGACVAQAGPITPNPVTTIPTTCAAGYQVINGVCTAQAGPIPNPVNTAPSTCSAGYCLINNVCTAQAGPGSCPQ